MADEELLEAELPEDEVLDDEVLDDELPDDELPDDELLDEVLDDDELEVIPPVEPPEEDEVPEVELVEAEALDADAEVDEVALLAADDVDEARDDDGEVPVLPAMVVPAELEADCPEVSPRELAPDDELEEGEAVDVAELVELEEVAVDVDPDSTMVKMQT